MRLWSLDPSYLDARGLVALWREALLARKVLEGRTKGYRNHPQLERFRARPDPVAAIDGYMKHIYAESVRRGYRFDGGKIAPTGRVGKVSVTEGQLAYELAHLRNKLKTRDRARYQGLRAVKMAKPNPFFKAVPGAVEAWERL
jgi:hypothetical protein